MPRSLVALVALVTWRLVGLVAWWLGGLGGCVASAMVRSPYWRVGVVRPELGRLNLKKS